MSLCNPKAPTPSCQTLLHSFVQVAGLPFADVLTPADCALLFAQHGLPLGPDPADTNPALRTTLLPAHAATPAPPAVPTASACPFWTPLLTVWTFLGQVSATAKSCTAAVLRTIVLVSALHLDPCSENPGAYSKARGRLPVELLKDLTLTVGNRLEAACPQAWRWHGRRVVLADGFTVSLPDTPENQQQYPQPPAQKKGLGFPLVRVVALFALATQVVVGAQWGPYQGKGTGETALLRALFDQLRPGDVIVADRYYCSYFMIVLLQLLGVDVVFHLHQRRKHRFGEGQRLGDEDELVVWPKPAQCPDWMTAAQYASLPDSVQVRLVAAAVNVPGFRTQRVCVVTTLLDATLYSKDEIISLYHDRWQVEGSIRSVKTYMNMDILRCHTPAMVHKELWAHLLAYNLIRKTMAQAAQLCDWQPWQISFTQTRDALAEYRLLLATATPPEARRLGEQLLRGVTRWQVGQRPNRVEPRQVKRRPKPYGRLMQPRTQERADILNRPGGERRRQKRRRRVAAAAGPAGPDSVGAAAAAP